MTANLLVLKFVDEGKLSVDEAVQLFETLAEEEDINLSEKMMNMGQNIPMFIIFSADQK